MGESVGKGRWKVVAAIVALVGWMDSARASYISNDERIEAQADLSVQGTFQHADASNIAAVQERNEAETGQTVIALVHGEGATVKRYYREPGGWIRLHRPGSSRSPRHRLPPRR